MTARAAILSRLKAGVFRQPVATQAAADVPYPLPTDNLRAQFIERLSETHAEVRSCDAESMPQAVVDWMTDIGAQQQWVSQTSALGQQLWKRKPKDAVWVDPQAPMDQDRAQVFHDIGLAVTSSHSALFETGTIALIPDQHEPRTMSLVPPIHLVVVHVSSVVGRFEEWIRRYPACAEHTNVLMITGPSKTADIQQTLAYGAHGPKRLLVMVVE